MYSEETGMWVYISNTDTGKVYMKDVTITVVVQREFRRRPREQTERLLARLARPWHKYRAERGGTKRVSQGVWGRSPTS